jgi:hypothetical protein
LRRLQAQRNELNAKGKWIIWIVVTTLNLIADP